MNTSSSAYKVIDPVRVADGFYGTTFHETREEAEERVAMFPGSFIAESSANDAP